MVVTLSALVAEEEAAVVASVLDLASVVAAEAATVPTPVEMVLVAGEDSLLLRIVELVQQQQLHQKVMLAMVVLYQ